jgi:hypothetical protein
LGGIGFDPLERRFGFDPLELMARIGFDPLVGPQLRSSIAALARQQLLKSEALENPPTVNVGCPMIPPIGSEVKPLGIGPLHERTTNRHVASTLHGVFCNPA